MAAEWFTNDGSGVSVHNEDPSILLIGDGIPDCVKTPDDLEGAAGVEFRVTGHTFRPCPKCARPDVLFMRLEQGYYVAKCIPGCGFAWCKVKTE